MGLGERGDLEAVNRQVVKGGDPLLGSARCEEQGGKHRGGFEEAGRGRELEVGRELPGSDGHFGVWRCRPGGSLGRFGMRLEFTGRRFGGSVRRWFDGSMDGFDR